MDDALARPFTLVCAPAGFGKTTLVTHWIASLGDRARVRVALARRGKTGTRSISCTTWLPRCRSSSRASRARRSRCSAASSMPAPKDLMALLLNEISETEHDIVLVLDDYHVIDNPEIDAAVAFFVERLPERLRLVVSLPRGARGCRSRAGGRSNASTRSARTSLRFSVDEADGVPAAHDGTRPRCGLGAPARGPHRRLDRRSADGRALRRRHARTGRPAEDGARTGPRSPASIATSSTTSRPR